MLNGSEASVTIGKCLIPETPLDKVPYTFKVKYTYCSGNRESVLMCIFLWTMSSAVLKTQCMFLVEWLFRFIFMGKSVHKNNGKS